jgi:hypothetical protein
MGGAHTNGPPTRRARELLSSSRVRVWVREHSPGLGCVALSRTPHSHADHVWSGHVPVFRRLVAERQRALLGRCGVARAHGHTARAVQSCSTLQLVHPSGAATSSGAAGRRRRGGTVRGREPFRRNTVGVGAVLLIRAVTLCAGALALLHGVPPHHDRHFAGWLHLRHPAGRRALEAQRGGGALAGGHRGGGGGVHVRLPRGAVASHVRGRCPSRVSRGRRGPLLCVCAWRRLHGGPPCSRGVAVRGRAASLGNIARR